MSSLNETPRANRISIAFFGLRNAGKSTLVNAFTGQPIAIVSDVPGTTTDPVSKAMEILPLGPCLVTDTAGLDDVGALGEQRVQKTLAVLATTDLAVWVWGAAADESSPWYRRFVAACAARRVPTLVYRRGDSVEALKQKIAATHLVDDTPGLLDGLVAAGDRVVCVCPIDESAPKGRLILPQVQVIRDCLDRHATCAVCQPEELGEALDGGRDGARPSKTGIARSGETGIARSGETGIERSGETGIERSGETGIARSGETGRDALVITDSQAFAAVDAAVRAARAADPSRAIRLTSFSILFARQKGDLAAFRGGLAALANLKDGDCVLVAEGCTHHRQCNDIGATKIPKALAKLTGKRLAFAFASGGGFALEQADGRRAALVVHCGGCMLTRREVLRRIAVCRAAGVPIVNYGLLLGTAAGVEVEKCVI